MAEQYTKWERFYNRLNLWFNGTVALSIIPFGLIFLDTQSDFPSDPIVGEMTTRVIQGIVVILAGLLIWAGLSYSKKQLAKINEEDVEAKLGAYMSIKIRSFWLLEAAAILAVIGFFITKDQLFSGIYLIVTFVFSLSRPTFEKVANDIRVTQKTLNEWGKVK